MNRTLTIATLAVAVALGGTACNAVDNPAVEAVVNAVAVDDPPAPPPALRWIHEGEPHPLERVNIIMRDPEGWRERCTVDYHGEAQFVATSLLFPGWGDEPMPVCLHAGAL